MPLTKEQVLNGLKELRSISVKRKFSQSVDLQIALKETDLKKPENKIKEFIVLPHNLGKKFSVAIFVDKELIIPAKKVFDEVIPKDDFPSFKKKRDVKRLVRRHKFFVAQANLMSDIARVFGRYLGPMGKMPDPKAGCIIPPKPDLLKPLYDKLQRTVLVRVKDMPSISVIVGVESLSDDELADNILAVYNAVVNKLPQHESQIKGVHIKLTMSRGVKL